MSTGWDFAVVVISTLSGLVVILDWLGIKPSRPVWGLLMPPSRNWKLAIMLGLMAISFAFSARGYYKSLHPRIVVVEKPVDRFVDRVVEKRIPVPCANPKQSKPSIEVQRGATVEGIASAPNSMAAGINTGTMMQGDVSPQFSKSVDQLNTPKNGMFETVFMLQVASNHTFVMQISITGHFIRDFHVMPEIPEGAPGIAVQMINFMVGPTQASGSLQNVTAGKYLVTVTTTQADKINLNVTN
jgi:hypothetical protein